MNIQKDELPYKIFLPLMRLIVKFYYNPKIINKEIIPKSGPLIIVSNHKHILDQCFSIIATKRPIHYLAKKEYFDGKFAWFFKLFGCISVNRKIHDTAAKNKAIDILNQGRVVGIFPEGTRNKTNDILLLPFKYGTVSFAKKTKALIIPSCITGDYKFRSNNLTIRFGEPFAVTENMNLDDANNILYQKITDLINQNLKDTNRTLKDELNSRNQDQKRTKRC